MVMIIMMMTMMSMCFHSRQSYGSKSASAFTKAANVANPTWLIGEQKLNDQKPPYTSFRSITCQ
jgi:hypothetical protein